MLVWAVAPEAVPVVEQEENRTGNNAVVIRKSNDVSFIF
jgi:hypothetical protein